MRYLTIILCLLCLFGCNKKERAYMPVDDFIDSSKPISYGNHQDVYIFSNQPLSANANAILTDQFGYPQSGAQKERTFYLFWKDFSEFEELKKAKNIMFICNLEVQDELTAFVEQKVSLDKLDYVNNISSTILTYQNEWSNDQLVSFVLSRDQRRTDDIITARIAHLYLDFEKRFLDRMTRRVYYRGTLSGKDFADYNYALQIPNTFQLYKEDKVENMISFLHRYKKKDTVLPDKFITIHHEKMEHYDFNDIWVKRVRERIGKVVLDGDRIDWDRTNIMPKTFTTWDKHVYKGYEIEGAWENSDTNMGGTFRSYAFYDTHTMSAYFIDTAVYFPAGTKIPFIVELEGIAKSFYIKE